MADMMMEQMNIANNAIIHGYQTFNLKLIF